MTRVPKFDAVLVIITAAFLVISLTWGAAPRTEMNVSLLGENSLAETRGAMPNYQVVALNSICACIYAIENPGGGFVCDCANQQVNTLCVVCIGNTYYSGQAAQDYNGWQPSGGSSNCNVLLLIVGDCGQFGNCGNPVDVGPCIDTFPLYEVQSF